MEDIKKLRPSKSKDQSTYEFRETEGACTGPAWVLPHVLCIYIMASSLEFLGIPEHMNKRDSIFVPSTVLFSWLICLA